MCELASEPAYGEHHRAVLARPLEGGVTGRASAVDLNAVEVVLRALVAGAWSARSRCVVDRRALLGSSLQSAAASCLPSLDQAVPGALDVSAAGAGLDFVKLHLPHHPGTSRRVGPAQRYFADAVVLYRSDVTLPDVEVDEVGDVESRVRFDREVGLRREAELFVIVLAKNAVDVEVSRSDQEVVCSARCHRFRAAARSGNRRRSRPRYPRSR